MTQSVAIPRVFNFSAGPAVLPLPVLQQIRDEMLALPQVGCSILEISHRSKAFETILEETKASLSQLLNVPPNYHILFLQGGSRLQFSMVPMNFLRCGQGPADYLVTGSWGQKAVAEARREGPVEIVWDGKPHQFRRLPDVNEWSVSDHASYVHYTSNETIQGVQFQSIPEIGDVPLICDMSSDFLSCPLEIDRYGLIYACAQKNAGPAGVTMVLVREDLLDRCPADLPGYLNFREHADQDSRYNTPPVFGIYVVGLVAKWLLNDIGGLKQMHQLNREKSQLLYQVIDDSQGFYQGHADPAVRSTMNVTFRLTDEQLDQRFLADAAEHDLTDLKGHRSVKGMRASIYNAMPSEGVAALAQFMRDFATRNAP